MNRLMKEYNAQRDLSFRAGMNVNDIENFQRQMNVSSSGRIGGEQSRGIIDKVQGLAFSAYTNPNPLSRESLLLREGGSSPFNSNGAIKSTTDILNDLTKKLKASSDIQAQAIGQTIGFSHDEVEAIRNRNTSVKNSANLTNEERIRREEAIVTMDNLRNVTGDLNEHIRILANDLGAELIPALDKFLTWIDKIVQKLNKPIDAFDIMLDTRKKTGQLLDAVDPKTKKPFWQTTKEPFWQTEERARKMVIEEHDKKATELQQKQDQSNQSIRESASLFTRDVNLFAGAVSTFAGVIDEHAALAAWAGGIGQAAGLGPMNYPQSQAKPLPSQIMSAVNTAVKGTNIPANVLAGIVATESGGNPNAVSHDKYGKPVAYGLAQINQSNFASTGITNPFNIQQNLRAAVQLLSQYLKASGGDMEQALRMYEGGPNQSQWGAVNAAYPGKVLGYSQSNTIDPNSPSFRSGNYQSAPRNINGLNQAGTGAGGPIKGITPNDLTLFNAQQAIAAQLGINVDQLRQGRVNKGDVNFARENSEYSLQMQIQRDQLMLSTPGALPRQQAEAQKDLRIQAMHLAGIKQYGSQIEGAARPGGRDITVNEKGVWIQVDGSQDPLLTGKAVKGALTNTFLSPDIDQMTNSVASGIKY